MGTYGVRSSGHPPIKIHDLEANARRSDGGVPFGSLGGISGRWSSRVDTSAKCADPWICVFGSDRVVRVFVTVITLLTPEM